MSLESVKSQLTPEEVALVFMEDELEDWTIDEVMDLKKMMSTTDQPVLESNLKEPGEEAISDDQWIAEQEKILKASEEKKKQQEDVAKKTHEAIEQLTKSFKSLKNAVEK